MRTFLTVSALLAFFNSFGQTSAFRCGESLTDRRDGQSYQTVLIGSQCWMKQNLNMGVQVTDLKQSDNNLIEKTCYQNDEKWCGIFGGLYTWDEAMQYQSNIQGICPIGSHLPTKDEWEELNVFLGTETTGQKLKARPDTSGFSWDGTNESGFLALPAGAGNHEYFKRKDQWALFWSSTTAGIDRAWFSQLDSYWNQQPPKYKTLYIGNYYLKSNGFSIRCILDKHK
jgi:uncharacterized protein (TIGR02145 family)